VTPAHHTTEPRWRIVLFIVLVVAGVGVAVAARGTPAPAGAGTGVVALVGAPDAESSAWYCTGQSTPSGAVAPGSLVLANTTAHGVTAAVAAVSDTGATQRTAVAVPGHGVVMPAPAAFASGSWEAQTVTVDGGGVAVSQIARGSSGWTESPCQSTTSSDWYFPGGTTSGNDALSLSLLNPTVTPVVVDLTFVTSSGTLHPINFQGIVVPAGAVVVEDVASVVQNAVTVSTIVSARTGRVVASELQTFAGSSTGLSIVPGATTPQSHWTVPQAEEIADGGSEIDVFNPGPSSASVVVHLHLASSSPAPLTDTVAPGSTWAIKTSTETRIPAGASYSADVTSSGGGVVAGRTVDFPGSAPQAGLALAVDGAAQTSPAGEWVVPPPGTPANPATSGVAPNSLALTNTSGAAERFSASAVSSSGPKALASGTLAPGTSALVSSDILAPLAFDQIVVRASGPMAVSEDVGPTGGLGVVTMPGLPLAAPIGS
jgi:Family of unknown function (DUF5719)